MGLYMVARSSLVFISIFVRLSAAPPAYATACATLRSDFNAAIAEKSLEKEKQAMAAIADNNSCDFDLDEFRLRRGAETARDCIFDLLEDQRGRPGAPIGRSVHSVLQPIHPLRHAQRG